MNCASLTCLTSPTSLSFIRSRSISSSRLDDVTYPLPLVGLLNDNSSGLNSQCAYKYSKAADCWALASWHYCIMSSMRSSEMFLFRSKFNTLFKFATDTSPLESTSIRANSDFNYSVKDNLHYNCFSLVKNNLLFCWQQTFWSLQKTSLMRIYYSMEVGSWRCPLSLLGLGLLQGGHSASVDLLCWSCILEPASLW